MIELEIGNEATRLTVRLLDAMLFSKTIHVGIEHFEDCIIAHLRREHDLMIGEVVAREIRTSIGTAVPLQAERVMEVYGRDMADGLAKVVTVGSVEIREAIREPISSILELVRVSLERIPAENVPDLAEHGILLVGARQLLSGMDRLISEETGWRVEIAQARGACD